MNIVIEVEPEETTYKGNTGTNLSLILKLSTMWEELKKFDRFCVHSMVHVPILVAGQQKYVELNITDYFVPSQIDVSTKEPEVIQNGFYEGEYDSTRQIIAKSSVWEYNWIEGGEANG